MKRFAVKYLLFILLFVACYMASYYFLSVVFEKKQMRSMIEKTIGSVLMSLQGKLRHYPMSEWNKKLQAMRPDKGHPIVVKKVSDLKISKSDRDIVKSGKMVIVYQKEHSFLGLGGEGIYVVQRVGHSHYVLVTPQSIPSLTDTSRKILAWDIKLMIGTLRELPEEAWSERMNHLRSLSGYPLSIVNLKSTGIPAPVREQLKAKDFVLDFSHHHVRSAYARIPKSQWAIKMGSAPPAFILTHFNDILAILFLFFIVLFIILSHLFFGRSLGRLFKITKAFSQGNFTRTTRLSKYSALHLLDQQIDTMGQKIQGLMNAQKSLGQLVAHESRAPISRMLSVLKTMKETRSSPNISRLEGNLIELSKLTDELSQYAQFQAKQLTLQQQSIRCNPWLESIIAQYAINPRDIKLSYQTALPFDQHITIDPKQLSRVLDNLIMNALRYAKQTINISADIDTRKITITVDDDGIIIPDEHKQMLFEPFVRFAQEDQPSTKGFGLGLNIAKTIVELHHGTLSVANSPFDGTRFIISLPL